MNAALLFMAAWNCPAFDQPELVGRVENPALAEASGLVRLAGNDGFWSHNDSGDQARLFAFDRSGRDRGQVILEGVDALDWEDLSAGPCGSSRCLFIGDIGDNASARPEILVHRVIEPAPPGKDQTTSVEVQTLRLSYPNGAIDAEGLAVDPQTGDLLIVTKNRRRAISTVYALRSDSWASQEPVVLEVVGQITWEGDGLATQATAAAIEPSGNELFVQTYTQGQRIQLEREGGTITGLGRQSFWMPWSLGQCEAMAFADEGQSIWFTCEAVPAPLARASCLSQPSDAGETPASSDPPTPDPDVGCGGCQSNSQIAWITLLLFALRGRPKGVKSPRRSL